MGSSQSKYLEREGAQEQKYNQAEFSQTQEVNAAIKNPLHVYTNYKTSLPIKTFSSLVYDRKKQQKQIKKDESYLRSPSNQNKLIKADLSYHSSSKQNMNKSEISGKQKSKINIEGVNQQQSSFPLTESSIINQKIQYHHPQQSSFLPIAINIQNFIDVKGDKIEDYYQFKQAIGEGAFGKVFRAICKKTGDERAIKKIKFKTLCQSKKKEFLSEMTLLSKLNHPSIIAIYQVFRNSHNYYVVMEYCNGGAVVDMLQKCSSKSEKAIASIMKQLLSALSFMHQQNIVHRDIKLDNLVFLHPILKDISETANHNETIPVKIIDFGSSVQIKQKAKQIHNYPVAGTLSYLAPEVMRGILTSKSDIWSSGVLLAILLTGRSPFKGKNQYQTRNNINSKSLKFKQPPFSYLSPQAVDLISQMLERNHRKRLTANEALKHPWFNISKQRTSINLINLQQLQTYERGNNLISVIESYISLKKVSQEERERLAAIFNQIDQDGNGMIDIAELIDIYKQNSSTCTQDQITHIVNSIDKNKSGKIDFNEFIIVMQGRKKLFIVDFLSDAFDYYDKDKKQYLQKQQICEILKGGDLAEVDFLIAELDKDGDNKISKQQFVNYLMHT